MNPIIKSRLPVDYQLLWQLTKKQRLSGDLGAMIQNQVKQVRKNFRNTKRDPLVEKYLNFGNEGMWSTTKLRELAAKLYENKKPGTLGVGEWISVELELVMPSEQAETDFIKFIRKYGFQDCVTIKNDGSIRTISPRRLNRDQERARRDMEQLRATPPDPAILAEQNATRTAFGREIVITFRYGDWKFVKMICGKLNSLKCFVNQSCGLHVHFDCRHIDLEDVIRLGKRVAHAVPALKQILPPSRQDNRFCAIDINEMQSGENRYAFVNLQSYHRHQTIEIRGHSGTTDAGKIVNWIRILRKIMDKRSRKPIMTVSELINAFKLEPDLVEYCNARYTKFYQAPVEPPIERRTWDDVEIDDAEPAPIPAEIMEATPPPIQAQQQAVGADLTPDDPLEALINGPMRGTSQYVRTLLGDSMVVTGDQIDMQAVSRSLREISRTMGISVPAVEHSIVVASDVHMPSAVPTNEAGNETDSDEDEGF